MTLFCLLIGNDVCAQAISNGQIRFQPYELKQKGDSLWVSMGVMIKNFRIEKDRSLILTPVLVSNTGRIELPGIRINGKVRHKIYERMLVLKDIAPYENAYMVLKADPQTQVNLSYQQVIPFEEWMKESRLDLKEELCGCGTYTHQISVENLVDRVTLEKPPFYQVKPLVAYIKPPVETVKARSEQQEAFLDFPVGRTVIQPGFGNNPVELAKIERMISDLKNERNLTVNQVSITGYASPEGSVALNNRLARERAESLKSYLVQRSGFPVNIYRIDHGGEDWNGLLELVERSFIPYQEEVIAIIRSSYYPEERKQRLQSLRGGEPYRFMLRDLYPQLRRVVSRVDFTVRGFNTVEASAIITRTPQLLSLEEMFMVAVTYPEGSHEFAEVFETAIRMFPEDGIANHNAAATALLLNDLEQAGKYLERSSKNTPEYLNNQGVFYLLSGKYELADKLLKQAAGRGQKEAIHNLEELNRKVYSENGI